MNLILAFATGYTKAEYEPFLKSARLANLSNTVRIVLFTDLDKTTFQEYPFVEIVNVNDDGHKPQNQNFIAPVLRYGYYLKYLKMLCGSDDVGGIMLADVRDVLFQHFNIFSDLDSSKIYVFKENSRYTFGDDACHKNWFNSIGRGDFSTTFAEKTFYCSGIHLFGSVKAAVYYLDLFTNVCEIYRNYKWAVNDQPIHNILIYENYLSEDRLVKHESELNERVFNMGLCREEDYTIVGNRLCFVDTAIYPSVIHQYDRRLNRTKTLLQHP